MMRLKVPCKEERRLVKELERDERDEANAA